MTLTSAVFNDVYINWFINNLHFKFHKANFSKPFSLSTIDHV